jgi:hypothetical protein
MKKLALYYHIWSPPSSDIWKLFLDEQIKRIYKSGITKYADIHCGINGKGSERVCEFVKNYNWINILEVSNTDEQYEGFTLKYLHQHSLNDTYEKVGYIHTKGISFLSGDRDHNPNKPGVRDSSQDKTLIAINSWRHFLEWGCVDMWKRNVDILDNFQVSGVNYSASPWPHYSGNFWWSRSDYIKTLENPIERMNKKSGWANQRLSFESWIGIGNPKSHSIKNIMFQAYYPQNDDIYPSVVDLSNFYLNLPSY